MRFGYIRVSTREQNTDRQQRIMEDKDIDRLFIDHATGANTDRLRFQEMMKLLREGDTVIVESISRISRNTRNLLEIVEEFEKRRIDFVSLKENIDTSTSSGKFMLSVFGAMAQLERDYIKDRQKLGIEIAKEKGKYKGRVPKEVPHFEVIYREWKKKDSKINGVEAAKLLRISKTNFYERVKKYEKRSISELDDFN